MAIFDALASLRLRVEGYGVERLSLPVAPDRERVCMVGQARRNELSDR